MASRLQIQFYLSATSCREASRSIASSKRTSLRFAPEVIAVVRERADELGYSNMDMLSGAGHDAMNVARVAPTGMIFVPCQGGLSHNEAESATPDDLAAGAHVLLHTLLSRAARSMDD